MSYDRSAYAAHSHVNNTRMHMSAMRRHKHRGDSGLSPHMETEATHVTGMQIRTGDDHDDHRGCQVERGIKRT